MNLCDNGTARRTLVKTEVGTAQTDNGKTRHLQPRQVFGRTWGVKGDHCSGHIQQAAVVLVSWPRRTVTRREMCKPQKAVTTEIIRVGLRIVAGAEWENQEKCAETFMEGNVRTPLQKVTLVR